MGAFISLEGIKYRLRRHFKSTAYDQETLKRNRKKTDERTEIPDRAVAKAIVQSLQINAVTDLPTFLGVSTTVLVYSLLTGVFAWLVFTSYHQIQEELFLSLDTDEGNCEEVPLEVSGTYFADNNGNWEGDEEFVYSNALYAFRFNRLEASMSRFADIIDIALNHMDSLSEIMKRNNLALTILFWTTWAFVSTQATTDLELNSTTQKNAFLEDDKTHYFYLTGSISTVFNQANLHSTSLNNVDGECDVLAMARYDKTASLYRLTFTSAAEYLANEHCMNILDIRNLGYIENTGQPQFDIVIDVQTVLTCVSVNMGVIPLSILEVVPHSEGIYHSRGKDYRYARYFYSRFPNMNTMYCTTELSGELVSCALRYLDLNLLPVFNHMGYLERGNTGYCECDSPFNFTNECNVYSFITGFIFYNFNQLTADGQYNVDGNLEGANNYFDLSIKYKNNLEGLNRDAFDASKESAVRGLPTDQAVRESIYEFCTDGMSKGCSMMTISSYSTGETTSISENYYQVPWGHCNDTTTISDEAREKLYIPPVRLTEVYYECRKTKGSSLSGAVGISSGTALSVKVVLLILLALVLTKKKNGNQKPGTYITYGIDEREEALHYVVFNLLTARDKRSVNRHNMNSVELGKETSLIAALAEELARHPYINRFFPISTATDSKSTAAADVDKNYTPTFEEMGDYAGAIELPGKVVQGRGGEIDDGRTDRVVDHASKILSKVSDSLDDLREVEFKSELLPNPFFVPEEKTN